MSVQLPSEKSGIDNRFCVQKFGIIGAAGIGKSSFFAQDDKAFFIEAEAGLNFLSCYKLPARSWGDLRDIYVALMEAKQKAPLPYSIIVIDTIDRVLDYAEDETIARAREFYKKVNINTVGDIPEGRGWDIRRGLVTQFLEKLSQLGVAVAYVGHLENKTVKDNVLGEYHRSTISIGGKLGGDLLAWSDHTLHIESIQKGDTLYRTVYSKPTQSREAKSRGGIIPDGWRWSNDDKENYTKFRGLFK